MGPRNFSTISTFKIFISNLPNGIKNEDVSRLFDPYGLRIVECEVFKTNYAFVHVEDDASCRQAIKEINGQVLEGNAISVVQSKNETGPKIPVMKLGVSNIHNSIKAPDLRDLFRKFGYVLEAQVRGNQGHVLLEATGDIRSAITEINGLEVQGQQLKVEAVTNFNGFPNANQTNNMRPGKRKDPPQAYGRPNGPRPKFGGGGGPQNFQGPPQRQGPMRGPFFPPSQDPYSYDYDHNGPPGLGYYGQSNNNNNYNNNNSNDFASDEPYYPQQQQGPRRPPMPRHHQQQQQFYQDNYDDYDEAPHPPPRNFFPPGGPPMKKNRQQFPRPLMAIDAATSSSNSVSKRNLPTAKVTKFGKLIVSGAGGGGGGNNNGNPNKKSRGNRGGVRVKARKASMEIAKLNSLLDPIPGTIRPIGGPPVAVPGAVPTFPPPTPNKKMKPFGGNRNRGGGGGGAVRPQSLMSVRSGPPSLMQFRSPRPPHPPNFNQNLNSHPGRPPVRPQHQQQQQRMPSLMGGGGNNQPPKSLLALHHQNKMVQQQHQQQPNHQQIPQSAGVKQDIDFTADVEF